MASKNKPTLEQLVKTNKAAQAFSMLRRISASAKPNEDLGSAFVPLSWNYLLETWDNLSVVNHRVRREIGITVSRMNRLPNGDYHGEKLVLAFTRIGSPTRGKTRMQVYQADELAALSSARKSYQGPAKTEAAISRRSKRATPATTAG